MPRPRLKSNTGLPKGWRLKNGAYRYQVPKAERHRWDGKAEFTLGKTLPEAYVVWSERIGPQSNAGKTVADLLDRYLLEVVPTKKPATQTTDKRIIPILRKRFGHMAVKGPGSPEPRHVYEYVTKRKDPDGRPALTRAHREMAVFSHALTWAVMWGWRAKNPFKDEVRLERQLQPKGRRERYVEDWEIIEALSLKPYRKRGSVLMCQAWIRLKLANIGLRATDMLLLKVTDADAIGITVKPSKTENSTGRVQTFEWNPVRRHAWDMALAARPIDIGPYVFCNSAGEPFFKEETGTASGFESIWQRFMTRLLRETNLKARFAERDLRAKVGSDQESIERAQRILGHEDPRVTAGHYRRKPELIK